MLLLRLVRRLRQIPDPLVHREDALRIAKEFAQQEGLGWTTPNIHEGLRTWVIQTAADLKPSPWIVIDNQTGKVLKHNTPRR